MCHNWINVKKTMKKIYHMPFMLCLSDFQPSKVVLWWRQSRIKQKLKASCSNFQSHKQKSFLVLKAGADSRCRKWTKHWETTSLSSIMRLYFLFSLLQTGSILWITARSSRERIVHSSSHNLDRLRSYTGRNSFQYLSPWIFFSLSFFSFSGVKITKRGFGGAATEEGDHQKGKLCTAGKKNHCVTPGEKYCCFA